MRILLLTYNLPVIPLTGADIRTMNFIKASDRDQIEIIGFNRYCTPEMLAELKRYVKKIWLVEDDIRRAAKPETRLKRLGQIANGIPWELSTTYSENFNRKFLEVINDSQFDVIIARAILTGQYLIKNKSRIKARTIVDSDDLEFIKARRRMLAVGKSQSLYSRFRMAFNNYMLARYYKRFNGLGALVVCSEEDVRYLRTQYKLKNCFSIPNAIDCGLYSDVCALTEKGFLEKTIFFCGNLEYEPNFEGLQWFIAEVFPLLREHISQVRLVIAGKSRHPEKLKIKSSDAIEVYPNVESVIPFYQRCCLVIAPIRIAGGTRIKILEAFACKRPVVATTIGAEGLGVSDNYQCLLRDKPAEFALACFHLLQDYRQSSAIAESAYAFVKNTYDLGVVSKKIRSFIQERSS